MKKWIAPLTAGLLAAALTGGPVMAQQGQAQVPPAAPSAAPASSFSDAQLEKFIGASQKVAVISQEYTPKFQASQNDEARNEVLQQADEQMVAAVREEGLTVDEFNGINQAAQQDPALADRIRKMAQ